MGPRLLRGQLPLNRLVGVVLRTQERRARAEQVDEGPAASSSADLANEQVEPRVSAAGGGDVGSLHLGRERRRPETAQPNKMRRTCARKQLPSPCCGRVVTRRTRMGLVLRREAEVVASLVSELSGAGQSHEESSRIVDVSLPFHIIPIWWLFSIVVVPRFVRVA